MTQDLTHFDASGQAHMVDVSAKAQTHRRAVAQGRITMQSATFTKLSQGDAKKGDVLGVARLAGIMAAKQTGALIPLCHPIALSGVSVQLEPAADGSGLHLMATARTTGPTGVEMEALTAVQVGLLTLYDMLKAAEKGMIIEAVRLVSKTGGKSGDWLAT